MSNAKYLCIVFITQLIFKCVNFLLILQLCTHNDIEKFKNDQIAYRYVMFVLISKGTVAFSLQKYNNGSYE